MALTKSARRAIRVSARKKIFNDRRKKAMKDAVKGLRRLVAAVKSPDAKKMLPSVYKAIDKAMKRGVIKKNAAARTKSRLAKALKKIS